MAGERKTKAPPSKPQLTISRAFRPQSIAADFKKRSVKNDPELRIQPRTLHCSRTLTLFRQGLTDEVTSNDVEPKTTVPSGIKAETIVHTHREPKTIAPEPKTIAPEPETIAPEPKAVDTSGNKRKAVGPPTIKHHTVAATPIKPETDVRVASSCSLGHNVANLF
jgi:hypothetical protein